MQLKRQLKKFFADEKAENEEEIKKALELSSELEKKIIIERFTGGNAITAQFKFNISEAQYYRKVKKFFQRLEKLIVLKRDKNI